MRKFQTIFENHLKTVNLKKVRIKLDPIYAKCEEYAGLEGYVGYILAENKETVTLFVEDTDQIQIIPISCIEICENDPKLNTLINVALSYVIQFKQASGSDPVIGQLRNAASRDNIEIILKQHGCGEEDILNIYKEFYNAI